MDFFAAFFFVYVDVQVGNIEYSLEG
jgi:hypothetical protein